MLATLLVNYHVYNKMLNSTELSCSGLLFNISAILQLFPNSVLEREKSNRLLSKFKLFTQNKGKFNIGKTSFSLPSQYLFCSQ